MNENPTRIAIVQAINQDDGRAVSEDVIIERVNAGARNIKSALKGLEAAGVLRRSGYVGETFWSIDGSASKDEIRQALQSRGVGEVADQIMDGSSLLGEPGSAGRDDDIFEHLL